MAFAATAAACLASSMALGGEAFNSNVAIYTTPNSGGQFIGSLAAARYSPDAQEYIGCEADQEKGGTDPFALCFAMTSNGVYTNCFTTDPTLVQYAAMADETTTLRVDFSAQYECTEITLFRASYYLH
jgi:hypothetical protein